MSQIDTHRAAYVRMDPNMKIGKQRPSKQSIIDRLSGVDADLARMKAANLPETERVLLERAMHSVLVARRALRLMATK